MLQENHAQARTFPTCLWGADLLGIDETKVMPIGVQSTGKACEAVLAREFLQPGQTRCRSPAFAVPLAFRSETRKRIEHQVEESRAPKINFELQVTPHQQLTHLRIEQP